MLLGCLAKLFVLAACAKAVLLPSQDPFYAQPSNISSYAPGAIIDARSMPTNINSLFPNEPNITVEEAYQYLYRTTDSLGNAVAAVTTLLVPYNADSSKLLSYQTAYITAALDQGWYVVTSDYEGLQAQYVAGVQAGYATLDSVRAVFNDVSTNGVDSKARYVMWGYSGGSLASEWAALSGLIPNVTSVLQTINKGANAGLAFSGVDGLSTYDNQGGRLEADSLIAKAYPDLKTWLDKNLIASKKPEFQSIASGCLTQTMSTGASQDLFSYFTRSQQSLYDPVPQSVLNVSGIMGQHGIPTIPMFIFKAIGDDISPSKDTDVLVDWYCGQKDVQVNIEYHKDVIGNHATEAITGSASAFEWVAERLEGKAVKGKGCVVEYVALTSVDLGTVGKLGAEVVAVLQDLLGGRLGTVVSG
ncbi:hypothetical protein PRZ48_001225 [Zasmidium cellare]|uniref:LIP-domain-containing protein n=1 Tax=Zasmidium cellare TaxID=395010 RepID=A0ABR0F249_ZASCE|nr:hypothetical protein PRZ48_012828 [Zasmidium cellare]KAK4507490.1 hypothetical protein PRZ48_001225 [Zasmidium cellare]